MHTVFMIRDGLFGSSYEIKAFMILVTLTLVFWDWKTKNRLDYLWIFIFGTLIWSAGEIVLKVYGIRDISNATLLSFELSKLSAALLRGAFEGAAVAIFGVFIGDRLFSDNTKEKRRALLFLLVTLGVVVSCVWMQAIPLKNSGGEVISRRNMLHPAVLSFVFGSLAVSLFWWFWRGTASQKRRVFKMYLSILLIVLAWTIAEVSANTRWIEVGSFAQCKRAPLWVEIGVLAYDIIIEVSASFLPFLIIPFEFKWIK